MPPPRKTNFDIHCKAFILCVPSGRAGVSPCVLKLLAPSPLLRRIVTLVEHDNPLNILVMLGYRSVKPSHTPRHRRSLSPRNFAYDVTPVTSSDVFAVGHRVPQSTGDASHRRLHGAAVPITVRGVDVHHHSVDSARCAHGVLRAKAFWQECCTWHRVYPIPQTPSLCLQIFRVTPDQFVVLRCISSAYINVKGYRCAGNARTSTEV